MILSVPWTEIICAQAHCILRRNSAAVLPCKANGSVHYYRTPWLLLYKFSTNRLKLITFSRNI